MPHSTLVKAVWSVCAILKSGVALAVIIIIALRLHNVSVDGDGDHPEAMDYACLLGWNTLRPASLCVYGYFAAGLSLLTSLVFGVLLVLTCGLFGLHLVSESAMSFCGTVWWAIAGGVFTHYGYKANDVGLPNYTWRYAIIIMLWVMTALHAALCLFYASAAWWNWYTTASVSRLFVDGDKAPMVFIHPTARKNERCYLALLSRDPATDSGKDSTDRLEFVKVIRYRARNGRGYLVMDDPETAPDLFRHKILFATSGTAADMEDSLEVVRCTVAANRWKLWNTGVVTSVVSSLAAGTVAGCVAAGLTWTSLDHALDETFSMDVWLMSSAVGVVVLTATTAFLAWGKHGQTVAEVTLKKQELVVSLRGKLGMEERVKEELAFIETEGKLVWAVGTMKGAVERYLDSPATAAKLQALEQSFPWLGFVACDGDSAYRACVTAMLQGLVLDSDMVDRLVLLLQAFQTTAAADDEARFACQALCAVLSTARFLSPLSRFSTIRALLNDTVSGKKVMWMARLMVASELRAHPQRYEAAFTGPLYGKTAERVCREEVEVLGKEGSKVLLTALARTWGADVSLGLVDIAGGGTLLSKLPDRSIGSAPPMAWLVHMPDRWGVIYPGAKFDVLAGNLHSLGAGEGPTEMAFAIQGRPT